MKHKTSPARLAQLLHTGRYAVIGCKLKQNANEGCNSCASLAGLVLSLIVCFIACFTLLVIAPLAYVVWPDMRANHTVGSMAERISPYKFSKLDSFGPGNGSPVATNVVVVGVLVVITFSIP